ncbi:MAG: flotillin-like FloA family protein, partial [Clostridia bacterium]|nr:flotillin-like FloA family protein [Clostridia bacterium]
VIAGVAFVVLLALLIFLPIRVYLTSLFSGVYISSFRLISMRLRKEKYNDIVNAYILAKKSNIDISLNELESVSISGGNPDNIIQGLIAARNANLKISYEFAKAVDISGRSVLEVVRESINPKVIEVPLITSTTQDNKDINVKVSLTLKTNLPNFLNGVGEETIVARAVEAVVTKVANTQKASNLLARPELIDKCLFDADIDESSKYELVSADVIHVDLGVDRNIAIEKENLEKNRIITANQMEHRRLTAVAIEHEMKAKAAEMHAKLMANEAEVPKAIVKAIEEGKIKDVVDYYKLQNLQADTEMRRHMIGKNNGSFDD